MLETWVLSLGWQDPLEKGMATHCSIFAWRILWTEEAPIHGSQRVGHHWVPKHATHILKLEPNGINVGIPLRVFSTEEGVPIFILQIQKVILMTERCYLMNISALLWRWSKQALGARGAIRGGSRGWKSGWFAPKWWRGDGIDRTPRTTTTGVAGNFHIW